jgi:hypothetical protein
LPRYRPVIHGSFQTGSLLETEDALEEVWSGVALHGSADYLQRAFTPPAGHTAVPYIEYAGTRARQAVEFRESARRASLLTSPLALYYSFLNLMRTGLCLRADVLNSRRHGLIFKKGTDLLSCGAELTGGTFTDYLDVSGYPKGLGNVLHLHEALARIGCVRKIL